MIAKNSALLVFAAALAFVAPMAHSSLIEFTLDCNKDDSSNTCTGADNWGKIIIKDNATDPAWVDITVDLVDIDATTHHKVQKVYLNIDPSIVPSNPSFTATGMATNQKYDPNSVGSPAFLAFFDLQLPQTGNLGFEPVTVTLALAGVNLDPSDFNVPATLQNGLELYAQVHVGNCAAVTGSSWPCSPGTGGDQSIKVGALKPGSVPGPGPSVPVPAPMALFGLGGLMLGWSMKRKPRA